MNSKIINWDNVLSKSDIFKNNKPFPFGFIENVFEPNFYKMLYETYPKVDSQWYKPTDFTRSATKRGFGNHIASGNGDKFIECQKDKNLSPAWNELFQYLFTDEFIQNIVDVKEVHPEYELYGDEAALSDVLIQEFLSDSKYGVLAITAVNNYFIKLRITANAEKAMERVVHDVVEDFRVLANMARQP